MNKMIFERMGANVFRKVRQLESLSKTSLLLSSRTSANLASVNQCLNSNVMNSGSNRFLTKFLAPTVTGTQFTRNSTTTTGDHVRVWVMEKVFSASLLIVIPAALMMDNKFVDAAMSFLIVMHTHWGLEAIITDYARPIVVGSVLPKVLHLTELLLMAATFAGLLLLIHNGPGVSKTIKSFWAIGEEEEKKEQQQKEEPDTEE